MPSEKFSPPKVTVHCIIKNEDQWIWYALMSVVPYVEKILIFDTGSIDNTIHIIKSINSPKITLEKKGSVNRQQLVALRQEQLDRTNTPWFMLLDGDEIWPQQNLEKLLRAASPAPTGVLAFFTRTRNAVGDIYHYLPDSTGHYQIKHITGHLNIRLIRNHPKLKVIGEYPLETYTLNGSAIQDLSSQISFVDTWYFHTTHLTRSTNKIAEQSVIDRLQKRKFRFGHKIPKEELPEVLWQPRPKIVPPPITNRWLEMLKGITLARRT